MINLKFENTSEPINLEFQQSSGASTSNYPDLDNKPQINGTELVGNKTAKELGLVDKATLQVIQQIINEELAKKLNDILIGGNSIVANGVADIPVLDGTNTGLVRLYEVDNNNGHLYVNQAGPRKGCLSLNVATQDAINKRWGNPLGASMIDYAVKSALCDGTGEAWTQQEQAMARNRLGLGDYELIGTCIITEDDVSLIQFNIDTKGQAFSLERFKLVFNKDKSRPITVNANSVVRVGVNSEDVFFNTGLQTINNIATYYEVYPDYALGTFASYKANNNSPTQDGTLISAKQNKLITQVQIKTTNGGFHNGLIVELWGVRA